MLNGRQDDPGEELHRSPLSVPLGERPRDWNRERIWKNARILAFFLAPAMVAAPFGFGLVVGIASNPVLTVVYAVVGTALAILVVRAAVLGYRRRRWPLLLGAIGAEFIVGAAWRLLAP